MTEDILHLLGQEPTGSTVMGMAQDMLYTLVDTVVAPLHFLGMFFSFFFGHLELMLKLLPTLLTVLVVASTVKSCPRFRPLFEQFKVQDSSSCPSQQTLIMGNEKDGLFLTAG